ncbi:MAG: hypothetical protein ACOZCO_06385 [Bacteroidota bacterium]
MVDSPIKNDKIKITEPVILPAARGNFGELAYSDGFVYWKNSAEKILVDLLMIHEVIAAANKVTKNTKSPMLIDFTSAKELVYTPTARTMITGSDFAKMRTAIAVLNSPAIKNANLLLTGINKFNVPLKIFNNQEEALDWLRTFILN